MKGILLIKIKLFLCHHVNKFLLSVCIVLLINTHLYYFIYIDRPECFNGAYELGIIFNVLSLSFIASYVFYFMNNELPGFHGKIKSYFLFFKRKINLDYLIEELITKFVKDEKTWNELTFKEKSDIVGEKLKKEYFIKKGILNPQILKQEDINSIVESHLEDVRKIFNEIQREFNSLNNHSRFLNSKLSFLILVVQEFEFFYLTNTFYSMGEIIGIRKWHYDTFTYEYASTIDHLLEFLSVFNNEINPYWALVKGKKTIDILK